MHSSITVKRLTNYRLDSSLRRTFMDNDGGTNGDSVTPVTTFAGDVTSSAI